MTNAPNSKSRLSASKRCASAPRQIRGALLCAAFALLSGSALANTAPQFSALADQYLNEGQTMTLTVSASDSDGDALTLGMGSRPAGVSFTDHGDGSATCQFSAEYLGPNSSAGSPFTLAFFASDGTATTTRQIDLSVLNVNRRPALAAPDTVFVEVGDTVAFSVSASDPDLDPVVWTSPQLPAGARLESASGTAFANFQWAPLALDSGVSTVTFIATDYWGSSDTASTTVVVSVGDPFTLKIATDTAFPGELVAVEVSLKNREAISAFELAVHVDASVMSVLSVSASGARAADFESFLYLFDVPTLGDIRINGAAAAGDSLPPGDGPLFVMNTLVSSQFGLAGLFLPITFSFRTGGDPNDNTMLDAAGVRIGVSEIVYVNGGAKVREPAAINRGDINLNGIPLEVADALRFTNYFINPVQYGFNAQQFANSDVNEDGIVASVADLVTLLSIVTGAGGSRIIPTAPGANLEATIVPNVSSSNGGSLSLSAARAIGGLYFEATLADGAAADEVFTLSEATQTAGFTLEQSRDENNENTVRVLLYSLEGGAFSPAGLAEIVRWSSDDIEVLEFDNIELASADGAVMTVTLSSGTDPVLPSAFALDQNYPNPFNPTTKIPFSIDRESDVTLVVYDILGRTVQTLAAGRFTAGSHEVTWDGADSRGSTVASGVYFYRLKSGERTLTRKMALLK